MFNDQPDGVNSFLVNGKQLAIQDIATGMEAKVWVTSENQVVISYQGTSGGDNGEFNHYGKVVMIGDKADSVAMQNKIANWDASGTENILGGMATVLPDFMKHHQIATQAANMGIDLSQRSYTLDLIHTQHGPVVPMENDSLLQAMDRSVPLIAQS